MPDRNYRSLHVLTVGYVPDKNENPAVYCNICIQKCLTALLYQVLNVGYIPDKNENPQFLDAPSFPVLPLRASYWSFLASKYTHPCQDEY
jgi:hypothetical protein